MNSIINYLLGSILFALVACQLHEPPVGVPAFVRSSVESVPQMGHRSEELKADFSMKTTFGDVFLPLRSAVESAPMTE